MSNNENNTNHSVGYLLKHLWEKFFKASVKLIIEFTKYLKKWFWCILKWFWEITSFLTSVKNYFEKIKDALIGVLVVVFVWALFSGNIWTLKKILWWHTEIISNKSIESLILLENDEEKNDKIKEKTEEVKDGIKKTEEVKIEEVKKEVVKKIEEKIINKAVVNNVVKYKAPVKKYVAPVKKVKKTNSWLSPFLKSLNVQLTATPQRVELKTIDLKPKAVISYISKVSPSADFRVYCKSWQSVRSKRGSCTYTKKWRYPVTIRVRDKEWNSAVMKTVRVVVY